jgi:hypothetical protein
MFDSRSYSKHAVKTYVLLLLRIGIRMSRLDTRVRLTCRLSEHDLTRTAHICLRKLSRNRHQDATVRISQKKSSAYRRAPCSYLNVFRYRESIDGRILISRQHQIKTAQAQTLEASRSSIIEAAEHVLITVVFLFVNSPYGPWDCLGIASQRNSTHPPHASTLHTRQHLH